MTKHTSAIEHLLFLIAAFFIGTAQASVIPIDLNLFFADAEVTVSAAGDIATFEESEFFFSSILSNDPGLGDPEVILAGPGTTLKFEFDFLEGVGEDDFFFAAILDSTGFSAGLGFEFETSSTSSGTVSFDLSALILTSAPFGLQFELVHGLTDSLLTSVLTISDLSLVTVDEPPVVMLMLIGLLLIGLKRRRERYM